MRKKGLKKRLSFLQSINENTPRGPQWRRGTPALLRTKKKNSEDETLLRPCTHATSIAQYQYHANPLGTVKQEFCTLILMS